MEIILLYTVSRFAGNLHVKTAKYIMIKLTKPLSRIIIKCPFLKIEDN